MAAAFGHEAPQGLVAAEADAVGVAGGDEPLLQGRHDGSTEGVMHNAVAIGGGGDHAPFGIPDFKLAVGPGFIGKSKQLVLQLKEIGLQPGVESQHGGSIALALLGTQGGGMECSEAGEAGEEISTETDAAGGSAVGLQQSALLEVRGWATWRGHNGPARVVRAGDRDGRSTDPRGRICAGGAGFDDRQLAAAGGGVGA